MVVKMVKYKSITYRNVKINFEEKNISEVFPYNKVKPYILASWNINGMNQSKGNTKKEAYDKAKYSIDFALKDDNWENWIARERYKDKFKEKDFYSYSTFRR